ncbi:MAG: tetratricopeptide repeat protein [Trueperaceae bacterium]|nr:tetratricopeptide repeat protein [Trueperaceae bacterium]
MTLRTFGALTLGDGTFTRPTPLMLLAYLAVEGPRERRFLAQLFWPHAADPLRSLGVALARLRRGAPGSIEADAQRAWATVPSDVDTFLTRLEEGDESGALEAYRGPFLAGVDLSRAGVELEEWVYATRELLAVRAVGAALELAERDAAGGRFEAAARRAAEALDWVDASVLEPEDLVRLHAVLRAGDHPRAAALRREAETYGLELDASRPEARGRLGRRSASVLRRSHPMLGTAFVGRDPELTEVASYLSKRDGRLLTVVGAPGVGKTRLALQVAHEQAELGAFRDGIHLVALEAVSDAHRVPAAIAEAMGLDLGAVGEPLEAVKDALRDGDALLVVDNVEHVLEGTTVLPALLAECPGLSILVTSRERLNVREEEVFPLGGLPLPEHDPPLEEAIRLDAVRLFAQRAKRAQPSFELDERTISHVLRICRVVEGQPLLLELAAVWVRVLPCAAIAEEIAGNLDLMTSTSRDRPERHKSLRGTFEHSWKLLGDAEREALKQLAVFQGGFGREAARRVAGATLAVLASLVDASLLRVTPAWRYDRHPMLHAFTKEKLAEDPQAQVAARERHGLYYARRLRELAGELDLGGERQRTALRFIDHELENVRAAWRWLVHDQRARELEEGSEALHRLLQHRGRHREGEALLREAIAGLREDASEHRSALGALRTALAVLVYRLGDVEEAETLSREGLQRLPQDRAGPAHHRGLNTLGLAAWRRGAWAESRVLWEQALSRARQGGHPVSVYTYLVNLAVVERSDGNVAQAEAYLREALQLIRAREDHINMVLALNNLGELALMQDQPAAAEARLEEALQQADDLGADELVPMCLLNLALAAFEQRRFQRAASRTDEALERLQGRGMRTLEIGALALKGRVAAARSHPKDARDAFAACIRAFGESGATTVVLKALGWIAEWHAHEGRTAKAVEIARHVVAHPATEPDDRKGGARLLDGLGRAAREGVQAEGAAHDHEARLPELVAEVSRDVLQGA